jgi:hypothetical protein
VNVDRENYRLQSIQLFTRRRASRESGRSLKKIVWDD